MKLKCDFVTNSSSCSFVMIGVKMKNKEVKEMIKKLLNKPDMNEDDDDLYKSDLPYGLTRIWEPDMIGKYIANGSSDGAGLSDSSTSIEKLEEYIKLVSEKLNVDKSKIKLYTGERNC